MKLSSEVSKKLINNQFEQEAWAANKLVCGIDEAGRGPLAGPVVISAVILPPHTHHALLKDSKIMTEAEREKAYSWIVKHCTYSVTLVNHHTIDQINIYQATKKAMLKAYVQILEGIKSISDLGYILIDAVELDIPSIYQHDTLKIRSFPFAESASQSVAAASIIAKVTRDRLMKKLHPLFPAYNFQQHKGYGTFAHTTIIKECGPSIIHRHTFIKNFLEKAPVHHEHQGTLFE